MHDPGLRLRRALAGPPILPATRAGAGGGAAAGVGRLPSVHPDGAVQRVDPPVVLRDAEQVRAVVARYLPDGYRPAGG